MTHHHHTIRVYYEDTDLSGYVYHAGYLRFMERGRSEWLRSVGLENSTLWQADDPCAFAVTHIDMRFLKPARMDEMVQVETQLISFSGARLRLKQTIRRAEDILTTADVTIAIITPDGRPRRAPDAVRSRLLAP